MPMVSTMPAMPGKVSVACRSDSEAMIRTMLMTSAATANSPNRP